VTKPASSLRSTAGADDYVTKPFGIVELLARLRATIRRATRADDGAQHIYIGESTSTLPRGASKWRTRAHT